MKKIFMNQALDILWHRLLRRTLELKNKIERIQGLSNLRISKFRNPRIS